MTERGERIAIVGGRGKTGRAVAAALGAEGVETVPVGRAELTDPVAALRGSDAVYLIAPNLHPDEPSFVADILEATATAGVTRLGYHSVCAPYVPSMPHHLAKAASEDLVRRSGLEWTILEPCAYVDNFLPGLRNASPRLEVPYDVDRPFGLVGLEDVGAVAAHVLLDPSHIGATYEVGGRSLVTVRDVAAAARRVLGTEVELAVTSPDEWAAGPGASLDPRERDWLHAMFSYYEHHGLPCGSATVPAVLGRPAHDLDTLLRHALL
ncbi:hypothetical protein BHE97_04580 [Aeromicrobium sp. PE09-221]|uniref:SDR family oxidoreductase n=1 Tax=Aeromicrobium sp. PE09-221 TaxID=1898043 RepID=UPI000B3E49F5|nr:NmrA family NAD(P)-binding protein [Aeromicrobium sp. PE09-221]OUZ11614.1 hypothetical protein BHE97_04580 [Aeromicrobium sp. PE09-221]